ncbi:MAG: UDP-N-acetylmuramoyl-tripeptide--D-alanyl-D-alanine ligase [Candidatus Aureabacteria bacterium]|nr:UDP-N-acetylmuramoyl-tripeptide--D-alanyl-D-alanine ligase [Candidatus Auribacterota bacterium]
MKFNSQDLKKALGKTLVSVFNDGKFCGAQLATDTRAMQKGDFFVPLKGPQFDGQHFFSQALDSGCIGFLFSDPLAEQIRKRVQQQQVAAYQVTDALQALHQIAVWVRKKIRPTVIALTGSNGKTTVKNLIGWILTQQYPTLYSKKSFNNCIGVPLTLVALEKGITHLVLEMGMNHAGEIEQLVHLADPDIVMVLNVSSAHLGNFPDFKALVAAKAEMISCSRPDTTLILNKTLRKYASFKKIRRRKRLEFGSKDSSLFCSCSKVVQEGFRVKMNLTFKGDTFSVEFPGLGVHNAENVAAAAACCFFLGVDRDTFIKGVREYTMPEMRMQPVALPNGAWLINDAYNANPASMKAAILALDQMRGFGKKFLVVGNMNELGKNSRELHQEVGRYVRNTSIDLILSIGELAKEITNEAFKGDGKAALHFEKKEELSRALKEEVKTGDVVLIKGSRTNQLETIQQFLCNQKGIPYV